MKRKYINILLLVGCLLAFAFPEAATAQALPAPQNQTISGDQLVIGNDYTLKSGQTLDGSLVIIGGNGVVESGATVNGDIALVGGNLDFGGVVNGSISFIGGNASLRSGATVSGDINSLGGNLEGEQLANITGEIRSMTPRALLFNLDTPDVSNVPRRGLVSALGDFFGSLLARVLQILGMAVLALLLGLIIPRPLKRVSDSLTAQPWLSGGVGLLSIVIVPIILVLLSITIILIPITLLTSFALGVAVVFGWIAVGYWVGERMADLLKTDWADAVSAGLGTLLLAVAVWLVSYIPCIGWLSVPIVTSLGLGGVILSRFGTLVYAERYPANRSAGIPAAATGKPAIAEGESKPEIPVEYNEEAESTEDPSE